MGTRAYQWRHEDEADSVVVVTQPTRSVVRPPGLLQFRSTEKLEVNLTDIAIFSMNTSGVNKQMKVL